MFEYVLNLAKTSADEFTLYIVYKVDVSEYMRKQNGKSADIKLFISLGNGDLDDITGCSNTIGEQNNFAKFDLLKGIIQILLGVDQKATV